MKQYMHTGYFDTGVFQMMLIGEHLTKYGSAVSFHFDSSSAFNFYLLKENTSQKTERRLIALH